nr:PREDICTED: uncharacterized protein LOC107397962 [Tribolium castaneum]|eukprot:XP_015835663.1 PREDICTED: uncharacterized protein LOC107397962 [Tribolium castaneum]
MQLQICFVCFLALLRLECGLFSATVENFAFLDSSGYNLSLKTISNNSVVHTETGTLMQNNDTVILKVEGKFQYMGQDGRMHLIKYTLDESGFRFITSWIQVNVETRISSEALVSLIGGGLG